MAFDAKRHRSEIENIIAKHTAGPLADAMRKAGEELSKRIAAGEKITAAVSHVTEGLPDTLKAAIEPALFQAACAGHGIWPSMVAKPDAVKKVLLDKAWTSDRMKLSERLHGTSDAMREAIIAEVSVALRANESWRELSKRLYDGYGEKAVINPAKLPTYLSKLEVAARRAAADGHIDKEAMREYLSLARKARLRVSTMNRAGTTKALQAGFKQLLEATETLTEKRIDQAVMVACEERARYFADRIARTETARAWFDGFIAKHGDDEDVSGYRWEMSTRHPAADICDMHSTVDFYGMGPGAYPKNKVPVYPAHPHCLCRLSAIYTGEAPDPKPFDPAAGDEYLKKAPDHKRKAVLGVKGERAWAAGKIGWEKAAAKRGWAGHLDVPGRIKREVIASPATIAPPKTAYKTDVIDWKKAGSPPIPEEIAAGTAKTPAAFAFMSWVRSGCPEYPGTEYEWVRTKGAKTGTWELKKATKAKLKTTVDKPATQPAPPILKSLPPAGSSPMAEKHWRSIGSPSVPEGITATGFTTWTKAGCPAKPSPTATWKMSVSSFGTSKGKWVDTTTKPAAPAAPKPAAPTTKPVAISAPTTAKAQATSIFDQATEAQIKKIKDVGGSTGAYLAELPGGERVVVKRGSSPEHLRSEFVANRLYDALGIKVPEARLIETKNGPMMISRYLGDDAANWDAFIGKAKRAEIIAAKMQVRQGFAVDALLQNWDVVGAENDNIMVTKAGATYRIDMGGALDFRARGGKKTGPTALSKPPYIEEIATLRDSHRNPTSAEMFKGIDEPDIANQMKSLVKKRKDATELLAQLSKTMDVNYIDEVFAYLEKRFDAAEKWLAEYESLQNPVQGKPRRVMPDIDEKAVMGRIKPPKSVSDKVQKEVNSALEELSDEWGMEKKEIEEKLTNTLQTAIDNSNPCMRIRPTVLKDFVLQGDGRFKTQFETKTSGGALNQKARALAEHEMFGYSTSSHPAKERPVYGYFCDDPMQELKDNRSGARHYGSIIVQMKKTVRDRTTVTFGDSLGLRAIPSPINKIDLRATAARRWDFEKIGNTDDATVSGLLDSNATGSYAEAQYHGGLSLDDVEKFFISKRADPGSDSLIAELRKRGYAVEVLE